MELAALTAQGITMFAAQVFFALQDEGAAGATAAAVLSAVVIGVNVAFLAAVAVVLTWDLSVSLEPAHLLPDAPVVDGCAANYYHRVPSHPPRAMVSWRRAAEPPCRAHHRYHCPSLVAKAA